MSEKLTAEQWCNGEGEAGAKWLADVAANWGRGGDRAFAQVFRDAQAQSKGALFRQPATPIERPPTTAGAYFAVPAQPTPTGQYFNVPGAVGHRGPAAPRRRVAEMITGRFQEIVGDAPIVWEGE